ncbi:MAG TPA: hypothetical protein VKB76_20145 [Ktedonobacterales bacterium]|nr:hypothetical protein [Ktedonobacterales bacterium]
MTESNKISLGSALDRVMVTNAEAHVFLSALAGLTGHDDISVALREVADDLAYDKPPVEPAKAAAPVKIS